MTGLLTDPEFEIVGELGRNDDSATYLARERSTGELVAVRDPAVGGIRAVSRSLNAGIPASSRPCPICRAEIADWRRYCGQCGTDLSGVDVAPDGLDDHAVVESVLRSANKPVELLGRMKRSEGGGAVWFGRDQNTGEIVALDLTRSGGDADSGFDVSVTATLHTIPPAAESADREVVSATDPADTSSPSQELLDDGSAGTDAGATTDAKGSGRICPSCSRIYADDVRFCPEDGSALRAWAQQSSLVGEIIANRYLVSRQLGKGGMGQVYLARHIRMGRQCAIKVLNRSLTNDVSAIGRFSREATNASRINHPNVAHIYDFGETPEHGVYLAMEYVEGEPLSKIIAAKSSMTNERVIAIATQVADALEAAHVEGVVHRDLTPNNIMIGRAHDGSDLVKVVDFGIAKASQDMNASLTATGLVIGTPQYMSPEQLMAEPVDGRSDIYSMGCVLFEMLTGGPPFAGGDTVNQFTRRLTEPAPPPSERNPEVWPGLSDVVLKALARNRDDRFESAAAVRHALLEVTAPQARPSSSGWLLRRFKRRDGGNATRGMESTDVRASTGEPGTRSEGVGSEPISNPSLATSPPGRPGTDDAELQSGPAGGSVQSHEQLARTGSGPNDSPVAVQPASRTGGRIGVEGRSIPVRPLIAVALLGIGGLTVVLAVKGRGSNAEAPPPIPAIGSGATIPPTDATASPVADLVLTGALPPDAAVRIDGQPVTVEGNRIPLTPGEHRVDVEAPGYQAFSERITLADGEETAWSPDLVPITAAAAPGNTGDRAPPVAPEQNPATAPVLERESALVPPPPTATQPDPVVIAPPEVVVFGDVARSRIETFRASLEEKDLAAVRANLTQRGIREFSDIFDRAGSRPLAVGVRAMVPDSVSLRTTFLIRIDVADGGENLLMWTDFVAGFQSVGGTWRLITVDRS